MQAIIFGQDRSLIVNRALWWLRILSIAVPALFICLYLVLTIIRIQYPFELEWMEGAMVDNIGWLLRGEALYTRPSLEFIPYIYTPLYLYVSAVVSKVTGVGFLPLRLVSALATAGTLAVLFRWVHRETGDWFAALATSGLFAATYKIAGTWFDIGRVDSLFLFFLVLSVYLLRFRNTVGHYVLAGCVAFLSFMTKQSALIVFAPVAVYFLFSKFRLGLVFTATLLGLTGICTFLFDYLHDGWFSYYVFYLPSHHPTAGHMWTMFWSHDVVARLPFAGILGLIFVLERFRNNHRRTVWFYLALAAGMLGASWSARLHSGGYLNVLFPAYAMLAVFFGLGLAASFRLRSTGRWHVHMLIYVVCIWQFWILWYSPRRQVPTAEDRRAGYELIDRISRFQGEVLIPYHGFYSTMAGKKAYMHSVSMNDIIRAGDNYGSILTSELKQAIRDQRFDAVIGDEGGWLEETVEIMDSFYLDAGPVFQSSSVFYPISGVRKRPERLYLPKQPE